MAAGNIRKKLITYLADADEKKVKAIYALFEEEINREEAFKLSEEHLKLLEERRSGYINGKDKTGAWQNAHERIRKNRKA